VAGSTFFFAGWYQPFTISHRSQAQVCVTYTDQVANATKASFDALTTLPFVAFFEIHRLRTMRYLVF
jgi:hypothetical protein